MGVFDLPKVCILLLAGYLGTEAAAISAPSDRVLRAATRRSDVFRRSMRIERRFDAEISYIEEENGWGGNTIFASQVKVGSEAPILNLEEIEHHLRDVKCEEGKMKLHFVDMVSARDAKYSCVGDKGGLIITSHEGCNEEGERAVYKVNDVAVSEDEFSLELSVVEGEWKNSFSHFDISFGYTSDDHLYRRHSDFQKVRRRRQESTFTAAPVAIPSDTPDNLNTVSFDLGFQTLNSTFDVADFLNGIENVVTIPDLPVEVGCKNCTTTGALVLTQGAFNIDLSQIDVIPDFVDGEDGKDLSNVITGGFFEIAATDLSAHIDLFARPKVSGAFDLSLFDLPIAGFVIPKIGKAGASFNATLQASYELTKPGIEVSYGFDVVVPSSSTVRVELNKIDTSGVKGFTNASLVPIPFSANVSDVEILLGLTFKPVIPIGFKFQDSLEAQVSVFMDLPHLDLKISTSKERDVNCNTLPSDSTTPNGNSSTSLIPSNVIPGLVGEIGPLVLLEANVTIILVVGADFEFPVLPPPADAFATSATIFSTKFSLSTSCLAGLSSFLPASQIYESLTKSYLSGGGAVASTTHVTVAPSSTADAHPTGGEFGEVPTSAAQCTCDCSTVTVYVPPTPPPVTASPPVVTSPPAIPPVLTGVPNATIPIGNGTVSVTGTPSVTGSPEQFTSAAMPGTFALSLSWRGAGWQLAVLGVSFVAGAMVLL